MSIQAVDAADFLLIGGVINGAGTAAVGVANTTLVTDNDVAAYVGKGATVQANGNQTVVDVHVGTNATDSMRGVAVTATSNEKIYSFAVAGSGAGKAGIAGSAVVNVLDETTTAYIDESATVNAANGSAHGAQDVVVLAHDETEFLDVAGCLAGGGTAGVGAGADVTTVTKTTEAKVWAQTLAAKQDVQVKANSKEKFLSIAAALGAGGTAGIAGSAGVYVLDNTTRAFIGEDTTVATFVDLPGATTVTAGGSVLVSGVNDTEGDIIAGAVSGGGTVGVGAAAGVSVVDKTTEAFLGSNADVTALGGGAGVLAHTGKFDITMVTDAGSEDLAEVPSVTISQVAAVDDTIQFTSDHSFVTGEPVVYSKGASGSINLADSETVDDGTSYYVIASDTDGGLDSQTIKLAETEEDARDGVAIDLEASTLSGDHEMTNGVPDASGRDVNAPGQQLDASADTDFDGDGTNDLNADSDTQTKQRVATAETTLVKGLAITAINKDDLETIGVSAGAAGTVAVNIGGSVNVLSNDTFAYVASGAKVNKATDTTDAATSDQSVLVAAGNDLYHMTIGGAASFAGTAAVTPGASVPVITNNTKAYIDDGAVVKAENDIQVLADSTVDILSIAAGVGGGGTVGIGVSAGVIVINNTTHAYIGDSDHVDGTGATANAGGDILISATEVTETFVVAGSLGVGFGAAGVGGAAAVVIVNKDTQAFVGPYSTVDAKGNGVGLSGILDGSNSSGFGKEAEFHGLAVQANSSEDLFSVGASAAGGFYAGVAGGVTVEVIDSDTTAYIGANANVNTGSLNENAKQSVNVSAANKVDAFTFAGALGIGAAGVAGGVDVGVVRNDTTATIGSNAQVKARSDVDVNALSREDVETYAVSVGGGAVGIAASVIVWSLGTEFDSSYSYDETNQETSSTSTQSETPLEKSTLNTILSSESDQSAGQEGDPTGGFASNLGSYSATDQNGADTAPDNTQLLGTKMAAAGTRLDSSTSSSLIADALAGPITGGTKAYIATGADVRAGDDVNIRADDWAKFYSVSGSAAIGGGAIGASVVVVNINSNVSAYIDDNAQVQAGPDAGDDVLVRANFKDDLYGLVIAGQVSAGASVGAQVVVFNDTSDQVAFIDKGATVSQAGGTVTVEAKADRDLEAWSTGGGLSLGAAAGASVAVQRRRMLMMLTLAPFTMSP